MKIGYPCINRSIGCTSGKTFRLASYSDLRMEEAVANNIACLDKILRFNAKNSILFFRISSDTIPFASHPVCKFDWKGRFAGELRKIGLFIKKSGMRISMHPDQFVLINALDDDIVARSVAELEYHAALMDAMGLSRQAKIQIHVGGAYGDKRSSIERFAVRYEKLPDSVRRRLAVENDDRLYSLSDCMRLHELTGIPVIFDTFHHQLNGSGEAIADAAMQAASTWKRSDGVLMCDYSSQKRGARVGSHAEHIDLRHFERVLAQISGIECDIMLEIKDKEKSAIAAVRKIRV